MKNVSNKLSLGAGMVALSLAVSSQVYGGGVNIYEMGNAGDVGYAGAGLAARAQDASIVFNNPAGMTRIKTPELFAGATFLYLNAPFKPGEETTVPGPNGGTSELFAGGNVAYVHPLGSDWTLGISAQNFLGLTLAWGDAWVGRYQAKEEWLLSPQIQPTVAYEVNDWLSLGAGVGVTVGYLESEAMIYNPKTSPLGIDGQSKYQDTDFTVQGNFGVMLEPDEDTRVGVRYLTEAKLEFSDTISLSGVPLILEAGVKAEGPFDIDLYMPQSVNISGFHQINEKWAILGSLGWEDWSKFGAVRIGFDEANSKAVDLDANDVYHFGIGGQYRWDPQLLIHFGFSFDSKMFDDDNQSVLLPMTDMYRYGAGFTYDMHENFTIGAGMDFLWEGDIEIKKASSPAGDLDGEYSNVWFIFTSVYGIWRF